MKAKQKCYTIIVAVIKTNNTWKPEYVKIPHGTLNPCMVAERQIVNKYWIKGEKPTDKHDFYPGRYKRGIANVKWIDWKTYNGTYHTTQFR